MTASAPKLWAKIRKIIAYMNEAKNAGFVTDEGLVGGSAYDAHGSAISEEDMGKAPRGRRRSLRRRRRPEVGQCTYEVRPEAGLLRLRKDLQLFANLRPAICYPALASASSLKPELVDGLDIPIIRELTGGVYFGEPKEIIDLGNGQKRGIDTQVYDTYEIERIAGVAFELAAHPQQSRLLDGKAQRHEIRRALEPGGHRDAQGKIRRRPARAHAC